MTFLQLINKVLVRLRQDAITSLSDSGATLAAHFVNQAKEEIEDIGPWKALRSLVSVPTVQGTEEYLITGSNERSYPLQECGQIEVFETTSNSVRRQLQVVPYEALAALHEKDTSQTQGVAEYVAFNKTATGLYIRFYPIPESVRTYKVRVVIPQAELAAVSTALTIPSRPVWLLAAAYMVQERGEELSGEPGQLMAQARIAIDNAMLTDFGGGVEEFSFYVD